MQITLLAFSYSLLASTAIAVDLQLCHGGVKGVCQNITFTSPETTCYPTVNATVGPIDTIVGITPGIQYTLFTAAGCGAGPVSAVFGDGTNTLVAPFLDHVSSISAGIVTVWTPLGCFTDFAGSRTLAAATLVNDTMTIEECQTFCDSGAFGFAGVEFGSECYCDFSIQFPAVPDNATTCDIPCAGNATEICGGASHINIFSSGKPLPTIPATVIGPNTTTWTYDGCFTDDSVGNRTFPLHLTLTTGVVPQTCVDACSSAGQTFAGLEFGIECWCGTDIESNATKVDDIQCGQACTADPSFFCGDADRLNVWTVATTA